MTAIVTLTSKNQMTLPVTFVKELGLKKGQKLWTRIENNKIVIDKVDSWDDLQGIAADSPVAKKYTVKQAIKIAEKKEAMRLRKKWEKYS